MSATPSRPWPILLAILALATALRLPAVLTRGLDGDEIFTLDLVRLPLGDMLQAIRTDMVHPPAYYLVEAPAVALLSQEPFGLRALSLVASLALVLLAWRWAREAAGPAAGLVAALLAAAALPLVLQSANARSYALYALEIGGLALVLDRLRRGPDWRAGWWAVAALATVAVLTHYLAALYLVAALAALALDRGRRRLVPRYLVAMVAPMLALAAWVVWLLPAWRAAGGLDENLSWMAPPNLFALVDVFVRAVGPAPVSGGTRMVLAGLVVLAAAALLLHWRGGLNGSVREAGPRLALAATLGLLPPVILFILSRPPIGIDTWAARHLLPSVVPIILLVTGALAVLARDGHRIAWALAAPLVTFHVSALAARMERPEWDQTRELAEILAEPEHLRDPARTTYRHGIAKPVNHYLRLEGVHRDSVLPLEATRPPEEFLLLLRPRMEPGRSVLRALRRTGWEDSTLFDAGGGFGMAVVEVDGDG